MLEINQNASNFLQSTVTWIGQNIGLFFGCCFVTYQEFLEILRLTEWCLGQVELC